MARGRQTADVEASAEAQLISGFHMGDQTGIDAVAHLIQLAIAPVFLLSGIGAILAVMTNRVGRIIDRARVFEANLASASPETAAQLEAKLRLLSRRAKSINYAITLCTTTALLVCAVIVTIFLGAFMRFDASIPIALLFIGAMLAFFVGLLFFLHEIFVATANLRIGIHEPPRRSGRSARTGKSDNGGT